MPTLHELQQAMARAVISGQCEDAAAAVIADAPGAFARLRIYHNHYRVTLIEVLASAFPATLAAVGENHFRAAARGFILTQPPTQPSLAAYGAGFPTFLAQLPPFAAWPYLTDLARLDWALNAAVHAPDALPIAGERLAQLDAAALTRAVVRLHPSSAALASSFPVDRIRHAVLAGETLSLDEAMEHENEAPGLCRLLIFRAGEDVGWLQLPPGAFVFVVALLADASFAEAAREAVAVEPSFDAAATLAALLNHGVVVDISPPMHDLEA